MPFISKLAHSQIFKLAFMSRITTRALCIIEHERKLLASINTDPTSGEQFYRLIGGGVEFGETGEAAVRREIMEELGSKLENLQLVTILENIFVYDGKPGHEIVFLFSGDLVRKELYSQPRIRIVETNYELEALWVPIEELVPDGIPLYPPFDYQGLYNQLETRNP